MGNIYEALQAAAKSQPKGETSEEKSLLLVKLAEIKEISDKLFEQIEKKIEVMKALEASVGGTSMRCDAPGHTSSQLTVCSPSGMRANWWPRN